ncbi:unnamed protein product [Clonostachys solani]|uniref:Uncharacterized protein n=1 Tax=Clonostachys solani TaxID=160281 RepID=A0A9P0EP38_9HYPO|nr:unnamed protein product [Clonostachys solani]
MFSLASFVEDMNHAWLVVNRDLLPVAVLNARVELYLVITPYVVASGTYRVSKVTKRETVAERCLANATTS